MRIALCLIPLVVIACDSPGGGGGGTVNCAQMPNAPICNPDVTTTPDTVQADTGGDTGPSDPDTQIDTIDDTGSTHTSPQDTTQPDTTPPPECNGSATRCAGNDIQLCNDGFWVTTQTCTGNATCQNGACVATSTCTNGTRRCTGNNVEQCSSGQWVVAEACTNGCANNQCNTPPTGLSCFDTYRCISDAGCFDNVPTPPATSCTSPCLNQASTIGRNEMNAMLGCFSNCSYDGTCTIHNCSDERAACLFDVQGNRTCEQVYDCLLECENTNCEEACWNSGTVQAQAQLEYALACFNVFCEDPQSSLCSSNCSAPLNACFP